MCLMEYHFFVLKTYSVKRGSTDSGNLFIDDPTNELLSRSVIKAGDVLISIAGTIGRCAIVPRWHCST